MAGRARAGETLDQLQAARLAVFTPALLGRAVPNCLGVRAGWAAPEASFVRRRRAAGGSAPAGRLKAAGDGRTAASQGERLDSLFGHAHARNQHHAAMGRFVLVLPAFLRPAE